MELKREIIETAELLLNMLEHCEDEGFFECVTEAIYNNDIMVLYNLEDSLDE